jgi:hypothetical protein
MCTQRCSTCGGSSREYRRCIPCMVQSCGLCDGSKPRIPVRRKCSSRSALRRSRGVRSTTWSAERPKPRLALSGPSAYAAARLRLLLGQQEH